MVSIKHSQTLDDFFFLNCAGGPKTAKKLPKPVVVASINVVLSRTQVYAKITSASPRGRN